MVKTTKLAFAATDWEDNAYIPHIPTGKQQLFLSLPQREAFYGGAAGGGKSDALLMGALQDVDNPHYSAIIFRKTFADLRLPGALIDRSLEWLQETDARWSGSDHAWRFPSGAVVAFGYLDTELNKYRYQSAEFQYIALDELTQYQEEDYLYMFSRLRRTVCPIHKVDPNTGRPRYDPDCPECHIRLSLPLRMRSASNPGGRGHIWVKNRFRIQRVGDIYRGTHPNRPHIPAFVRDNPHLDQQAYIESMQELDPITREQLLRGDWGVSADSRIRKSWMKYYSSRPGYVIMGPDGHGKAIGTRFCSVFMTVDPAASVREGPGDIDIWRRMPSWTVIGVWLLAPNGHLFLVDCRRMQCEVPDVIENIIKCYKDWADKQLCPDTVVIEADGLGIGVYQTVATRGLPVYSVNAGSRDKLVRATPMINRIKAGYVWLPEQAAWLETVESELFTWTGHPHETDDIVDMFAWAGIVLTERVAEGFDLIRSRDELPSSI